MERRLHPRGTPAARHYLAGFFKLSPSKLSRHDELRVDQCHADRRAAIGLNTAIKRCRGRFAECECRMRNGMGVEQIDVVAGPSACSEDAFGRVILWRDFG